MQDYLLSEFIVERREDNCIRCQVCERQCANDVHLYDAELDRFFTTEKDCVGCQRCVALCPTGALYVHPRLADYRPNSSWTRDKMQNLKKQAATGGVVLTGSGNDKPCRVYWDHLLLNAAQVTNPSIDPLREPMELQTFLGRKPDTLKIEIIEGKAKLASEMYPNVPVQIPLVFSAMSLGAISYPAFKSLAMAAKEAGVLFNTGEGGLPVEMRDEYADYAIVQCASGRFGVDQDYLNSARILEIKIGQGAKPGIGGHLPGEKVSDYIAQTRMIPRGTDALSPAPQHDIYSIEDLSMLIYALKEATNYTKPVSVKIAAVHNVAAIASGIVRAGADMVAIDGIRGGTGAAPLATRDNVGIPLELALAAVDKRLRDEGIRNRCSVMAAGGIRTSADAIKAIALGADGIYIGTAALVAMGCTLCHKCYTGKCNWGICTQNPYLTKRLNPELTSQRLVNLLRSWSHEIQEMLGGLGVNAIGSLRGNHEHLRGVGLEEWELNVLGVKGAGE